MDATHRTLRRLVAGMLVYVDNAATRATANAERVMSADLAATYRRSAQRARRIAKTALKALATGGALPGAYLVHEGTSGGGASPASEYELVGAAKGAGTSRGSDVLVYRDTATGQLYFRTVQDFQERMVLAGGAGDEVIQRSTGQRGAA